MEKAIALTPYIRLGLRYGVGLVFGMQWGDLLAGDPDVVTAVAVAVLAITETWYIIAKRLGYAT